MLREKIKKEYLKKIEDYKKHSKLYYEKSRPIISDAK